MRALLKPVALLPLLALAMPAAAQRGRPSPPPPPCVMPALPSDAKFILLGAHGGAAISPASIGGPSFETQVVEVKIEPGDEPLYIMASSFYPVIWRLSGATWRITRMTVTNDQKAGGVPTAGVVGLDRQRVTFLGPGCPVVIYKTELSGAVKDKVQQLLGRLPDAVVTPHQFVWKIALPSGDFSYAGNGALRPDGFDPTLWRQSMWVWSAGIADIEAKDIVGANPATPYAVLPGAAGLAQLVSEGAVRRTREGWRIIRPIPYFPAGLQVLQPDLLILAKGVPMPDGYWGGACLVIEDTGEQRGYSCGGNRNRQKKRNSRR